MRELVELLTTKYGVELPMADLFLWGTEQSGVADIKSAIYMGPTKIEGADCDHYAFRQDEVDWQIWIQQGDKPLPRKMVITTTTEVSRPDYSVTYKWNLAPRLDDKMFTFVPTKDTYRIEIEQLDQQPASLGRRD
ncbi:MAG: hypothetical protein H6Q89_5675 [Myxococcaceae bacterium]|nr:hypothetical protein [Myxococcaceae bacterium]